MLTPHLTNSMFFVFSCISHILLFMIIDYVLSSWNFNCITLQVDPQRYIEDKNAEYSIFIYHCKEFIMGHSIEIWVNNCFLITQNITHDFVPY